MAAPTKLPTHAIYSAAAGTLDSWDIENLKYIRRISQYHLYCNQKDNADMRHERAENLVEYGHPPTAKHTSKHDVQQRRMANHRKKVDPPKTVVQNNGDEEEVFTSQVNTKETTAIIRDPPTVYDEGRIDMYATKNRNAPEEDCYDLDVVTVRNASVLAECSNRSGELIINDYINDDSQNVGSSELVTEITTRVNNSYRAVSPVKHISSRLENRTDEGARHGTRGYEFCSSGSSVSSGSSGDGTTKYEDWYKKSSTEQGLFCSFNQRFKSFSE